MSMRSVTGPFEFIIGTADLEKCSTFLQVFGFRDALSLTVDEATALELYGCTEARSQVLLSRPDTDTAVRLVLTSAPARPMQAFEAGGHGIDFYTTDISKALEQAARGGGSRPSPVSWTIDTGRHLTEARIVSPDGSFTVFCVSYSVGGIPTILDRDSSGLFSEVSLTSWIIPADLIEREFDFWGRVVGYRNIRRTMLSKEAMVELMKLPHPEAMGCSMFADNMPRCPVDLLWYPDRKMPLRDDWPLRPGLYALGFKCVGSFKPAESCDEFKRIASRDATGAVTTIAVGRSPGGIRFHIHS